jgi:hypothetical protein
MEPILLPKERQQKIFHDGFTRTLRAIVELWMFEICTAILDQKSIVLYLVRKGIDTTAIHQQNRFATFGIGAEPCPAMIRILRGTLFMFEQLLAQEPALEPQPSVLDLVVTQAVNNDPFVSVLQLAPRTCVPNSAALRHLVNTIRFTMMHLRWVPHALSQNQKQARLEMSKNLPGQLLSAKHDGWRDFVPLDES